MMAANRASKMAMVTTKLVVAITFKGSLSFLIFIGMTI